MKPTTAKNPLAKLVQPCLWALACTYLGHSLLYGDRGLYALFVEKNRQEILQAELDEATAERAALEKQVVGLRDSSLDLDLLDEQMRRMMGAAHPDELIILRDMPAQPH